MQRKEFEDRVCNFIVQEALVQPGDGVVIGVSGGADSVALLRFFDHVKERLQISIRCVHVEHGIRGDESLRDQCFVEELCRTYGIAETSVAVGEQIAQAIKAHAAVEEMARTARYQALIQEAEAWEKEMGHPVHIAVAHHADDNGETMLFHLARGTGIDGMRGMPVQRERIIRPFLVVTRQEIEVYLEELQQAFCEDSSNTDLQYDRNRLRHQVMPELQKINAQAIEHLGREALYLGQVADYIKKEAAKHLKTARRENVLLAERVISQPAFMRCEILYLWLLSYVPGARDISTTHLQGMERLLFAQTGQRMDLPYHLCVWRIYEGLQMQKKQEHSNNFSWNQVLSKEELCKGICLPLPNQGQKICLSVEPMDVTAEIPRKFYTKWFDYDKIESAICLRHRREGDYLTVTSSGGHKRLQDYFVNEKVPREQRDCVPLVCEGNHVIWAIGYRISTHYKIDEHTKRILKIQVLEENDYE